MVWQLGKKRKKRYELLIKKGDAIVPPLSLKIDLPRTIDSLKLLATISIACARSLLILVLVPETIGK